MADDNEREDFQVDGTYIQDRDMDNNGIPDFQQNHDNGSPDNPYYGPGARSDDATRGSSYEDAASSSSGSAGDDDPIDVEPDRADFGPDAASDAPFNRQTREATGHASATYGTAKPGQGERQERTDRADAANEAMSGKERRSEANTSRAYDDEKYRSAMNDLEQRRLRNRPAKESRLAEELRQASNHHRTDDKDGLAIGKALMAGLKGGLKHDRQRAKERQAKRDNQLADRLARDFAENEAANRARAIADAKIERAQRDAAAAEAAAAKAAGKPEGDGPGTPGPDAPGPDNPGPQNPGPGGDGPGGDGPGGGKPAEETREPGTEKPKEAEVSSPEAPKPANENETVEPLRETGRAAERARALHGEPEGRTPSAESDAAVARSSAKISEPTAAKVDPKSAARDAASPVSSDVNPAEANASAGAGMAMAAVNPALGVAMTAAKSRHAQVEAGAEHVDLRKARPERQAPQSKGPQSPSISISVPSRGEDARTAPTRRLETRGTDNVVEFRRPERPADRPNGIRAQMASRGPHRGPDVMSRGDDMAQPRTRIMGVGSALGRFVEKDVRGPGGKGHEHGGQEVAAAFRSRGNGR